jgi:peroxiredoxin
MVVEINTKNKLMKIYTQLLTMLLLLVSISIGNAQQTMPNATVRTLSGDNVAIQDHASNGMITIISFWASWCSPCKKEMDAISEIYADWQSEYNVELLAITIDDARGLSKVPAIVEQKGWPFTIYSDLNQELKNALNFQTIPHTIVLDTDGNIVYVHSGYVPGDEFELEDIIADLSN